MLYNEIIKLTAVVTCKAKKLSAQLSVCDCELNGSGNCSFVFFLIVLRTALTFVDSYLGQCK